MTYQSMIEGAIETGIDYGDAVILGFKTVRTARARGYVSRKAERCSLPVLVKKSGELYVDYPAYDSTTYCVRIYLKAENNTYAQELVNLCKTKSDEYNIPIQQTIKRVFSEYHGQSESRTIDAEWECKTLICPPANGRFDNNWL